VPLPPIAETGDLPHGVYRASLQEVVDRFGQATAQRKLVAMRLGRVHELAAATGHLKRFIVFGSFVTAKPEPNDVDVFLLMDDAFELEQVTGEARLVWITQPRRRTLEPASFGYADSPLYPTRKRRS
jgi:hypothetical protein